MYFYECSDENSKDAGWGEVFSPQFWYILIHIITALKRKLDILDANVTVECVHQFQLLFWWLVINDIL